MFYKNNRNSTIVLQIFVLEWLLCYQVYYYIYSLLVCSRISKTKCKMELYCTKTITRWQRLMKATSKMYVSFNAAAASPFFIEVVVNKWGFKSK